MFCFRYGASGPVLGWQAEQDLAIGGVTLSQTHLLSAIEEMQSEHGQIAGAPKVHNIAAYSTPHHTTSHHITPHHTTSHHITSHRITSHHNIPAGVSAGNMGGGKGRGLAATRVLCPDPLCGVGRRGRAVGSQAGDTGHHPAAIAAPGAVCREPAPIRWEDLDNLL